MSATRLCPGRCGRRIPLHYVTYACGACWPLLPAELREAIETTTPGTAGHGEATLAAWRWYRNVPTAHVPAQRPAPRPEGRPCIPRQRTRMVLLISNAGVDDNDERRAVQSALAGRPLASSKDLTTREAAAIIDHLEGWRRRGTLVSHVAALLANRDGATR